MPARARAAARHPADLVLAAALVVAVPVIRYANRGQWFAGDEWDLLLHRHLTDPKSMLLRQNDHITTLPAVLYRLLYQVVGFHHYWPYQALAIGAHLGIVVLLVVVMRRAGVHPWIATASGLAFLFFGPGSQNMATGFQVTLTGAVLFGLLMLLGADHDGPLGRRDALAVAAGLAATACSATAAPMIGVVGLAVVVRRGWRCAAAVVAAPAALFAAWNVLVPTVDSSPEPGDVASTLRFARALWVDTFEALGGSRPVGWVLLVALVVGWALALRTGGAEALRSRLVLPASLLIGAVGLVVFIGRVRSAPTLWGSPPTSLSRYLYLVAALVTPALAVAAGELARRWRPAVVGAAALVLAGVPGNVRELGPAPGTAEQGDEATVLHLADLAVEMEPPHDMKPLFYPGSGLRFAVGPLRDARIAGEVPDPLPDTEAEREYAFLTLLLEPGADAAIHGCTPRRPGEAITVARGDRLVLHATTVVHIRRVVAGRPAGTPYAPLALANPYALGVTWGPAEVVVEAGPATQVHHCAERR